MVIRYRGATLQDFFKWPVFSEMQGPNLDSVERSGFANPKELFHVACKDVYLYMSQYDSQSAGIDSLLSPENSLYALDFYLYSCHPVTCFPCSVFANVYSASLRNIA